MTAAPGRRVLVAGIGNIFLGDDGFGVEVVKRMAGRPLPAGVHVADYGIRGIHLAFELLDGGYDTLIMVDAVPVDGPPGTLVVLEPTDAGAGAEADAEADAEEDGDGDGGGDAAVADAHGMHPAAVLRLLRGLGGEVERVLIVGCRPAVVGEAMGLSGPVRAVVDDAVRLVTELAAAEAGAAEAGAGRDSGIRGKRWTPATTG